jgi:catechol 2,3-dioxygenase-like lactoylglutathione lyase family enzyme
MSSHAKPGVVLFAKDLPAVARFYEGLVSMLVVAAEHDHVILESGGFQLVVHAIPAEIAESIEITSPPVRRGEAPAKLILPVASLASARAAASMLGGELDPAEAEWELGGDRVCDGIDPEGNVVQFRESAR